MIKHLRFDAQVQGLDLSGRTSFSAYGLFLSPFAKGLFLLKGTKFLKKMSLRKSHICRGAPLRKGSFCKKGRTVGNIGPEQKANLLGKKAHQKTMLISQQDSKPGPYLDKSDFCH